MAEHLKAPKPKFRFRPELNGLRAIAVTAVVLFHASAPGFLAGYLGVDVFFVLSGFLVTSLLLVEAEASDSGHSIDLTAFYSRRVRRLLPASLSVLFCSALAYRFAVEPLSVARSQDSFLAAVYYVANWAFIAADGDYWAEGRLVSPVKHYWSLSVEEQFYFAYPLLFMGMVWVYRKSTGKTRLLVPIVGAALCLLSFFTAVWLYYEDELTASYMNTGARLYQLLGGGLLAVLAPDCSLPPIVSTLSLLAMFALFLSSNVLTSLWGGFAAFLTSCFLILGLEGLSDEATDSSWTKRALSLRPLTFVGECSYSIYLVHFPLVVIGDAFGVIPRRANPLARSGLVLLGALVLGVLFRKGVEVPFRHISLTSKLRKYLAVLCIILVPLLVTNPLLFILTPAMHNADLLDFETRGGNVVGAHPSGHAGAPRVVTLGDSHCRTSNDMMSQFFREEHLNGRSLCQGSFPVLIYPNRLQKDIDFLETILTSLRKQHTDYLVVWNVKVQFPCMFKGSSCAFDSDLNDSVDEVSHLYEPAVMAFFAKVLPYVDIAVIIMLPEPVAPIDPHACLSAHADTSACDWDVWHMAGYEEAVSAYEAVAEASAAHGGPDVLLINTDEILCPHGRCHAVDHNIPLYSNGNHVLPATWVRLLPQVEELWRAAGAFESVLGYGEPGGEQEGSIAEVVEGGIEEEGGEESAPEGATETYAGDGERGGEQEGGSVAAPLAYRVATLGDSHCGTSNDMMSKFFLREQVNGRSFCQNSFPVSFYPNRLQEDIDFLEETLTSLREEHTDYLVVWNVKVQYPCMYKGVQCAFDSDQNDSVDEVSHLYEPAVMAFFDEVLPYVDTAVIIMLPEPVAPFDPHACLSAQADTSACDWDVWHMAGYEETVSAYEAVAEASAANGGPAVLLVNTEEVLCPHGRCHAVDHNIPLYSNANHVTARTWVRLLPQVEELWRAAGAFESVL